MIYGYIRVSTNGQTVENQKLAIKNYCRVRRLRNVQWVSETISGTKKPEKRKLGKLLEIVKEDDLIVVTELSRLGRSLRHLYAAVAFWDAVSSLLRVNYPLHGQRLAVL